MVGPCAACGVQDPHAGSHRAIREQPAMISSRYMSRLRCSLCSVSYPLEGEFLYTCPKCGYNGLLDIEYDYAAARPFMESLKTTQGPKGLGRYAKLLPILRADSLPPLLVGNTPLAPGMGLGKLLSMPNLYFKEDQRN